MSRRTICYGISCIIHLLPSEQASADWCKGTLLLEESSDDHMQAYSCAYKTCLFLLLPIDALGMQATIEMVSDTSWKAGSALSNMKRKAPFVSNSVYSTEKASNTSRGAMLSISLSASRTKYLINYATSSWWSVSKIHITRYTVLVAQTGKAKMPTHYTLLSPLAMWVRQKGIAFFLWTRNISFWTILMFSMLLQKAQPARWAKHACFPQTRTGL